MSASWIGWTAPSIGSSFLGFTIIWKIPIRLYSRFSTSSSPAAFSSWRGGPRRKQTLPLRLSPRESRAHHVLCSHGTLAAVSLPTHRFFFRSFCVSVSGRQRLGEAWSRLASTASRGAVQKRSPRDHQGPHTSLTSVWFFEDLKRIVRQ